RDDLLTRTTADQDRSGKALEEVSDLGVRDELLQAVFPERSLSLGSVVNVRALGDFVLRGRLQQTDLTIRQLQDSIAYAELGHVRVEVLPRSQKLGAKEADRVGDTGAGLHVLLELAVCLTVVLTEPDGFLTLRLKDSPERQSSVSLEQVFRRALPKSGQVIVAIPLQGGTPDVPTVQLAA